MDGTRTRIPENLHISGVQSLANAAVSSRNPDRGQLFYGQYLKLRLYDRGSTKCTGSEYVFLSVIFGAE
jgi:hypothetical protein